MPFVLNTKKSLPAAAGESNGMRIRAQGHFKQLAREAQRLGGFKSSSQAANAALAEYIDRLRSQQYRP